MLCYSKLSSDGRNVVLAISKLKPNAAFRWPCWSTCVSYCAESLFHLLHGCFMNFWPHVSMLCCFLQHSVSPACLEACNIVDVKDCTHRGRLVVSQRIPEWSATRFPLQSLLHVFRRSNSDPACSTNCRETKNERIANATRASATARRRSNGIGTPQGCPIGVAAAVVIEDLTAAEIGSVRGRGCTSGCALAMAAEEPRQEPATGVRLYGRDPAPLWCSVA